tara:strand:+ start:1169 stop:1450 length:282 start_codon:yes stop_codon:yes gene_type:complete
MYAIKVYLTRPKKSGLSTKGNPFMQDALEKNYYLMRDFEDNVVHVFTRKEKAEKTVNELQEQNPKMLIQLTEDIPAAALARALKKKQIVSEEK